LHCSRQEILDYAAAHDLRWIEDESNADDNYPRNFLRHRVLPLLSERFPAYRDTLARSAQHFAEASKLLDELAQQDAQNPLPLPLGEITSDLAVDVGQPSRMASSSIRVGERGKGHDVTLEVSRLQSLTQPRAKNLLRYFLHGLSAPMPQAVQLDDMLQQLCRAREDAAVCIAYGDWQVRRYQGKVYALRALGEFDRSLVSSWHGEAELDWPALNTRLYFDHTHATDISLAKLQRAPVTLRLRSGGETLRPQPNAATRTLKNLLQEHHVPPWQRDRLPLLYCGDELVCVPGVAIAAEYQAVADEAGIAVVFCAEQDVAGGENNSSLLL
jgi:tRNA(Ile)-lysidine synthase